MAENLEDLAPEEDLDDLKAMSSERRTVDIIGHVFRVTTNHGFGHAWSRGRTVKMTISSWLIPNCATTVVLLFGSAFLVLSPPGHEASSIAMCSRPHGFGHHDRQQVAHGQGDQAKVAWNENDEGLQLPSVAICNLGLLSKSRIEAMNIPVNVSNFIMGLVAGTLLYRPEVFVAEEGRAFLQESTRYVGDLMKERNLTLVQLVDALSLRCEDMIAYCEFGLNGGDTTLCCGFMTPIPTTLGQCYVSFAGERTRQIYRGAHSSFSLIFKDVTREYPGQVGSCRVKLGHVGSGRVKLGHVGQVGSDIDTRIIDPMRKAKQGLQISLFSNLTHPGLFVAGGGTVIPPGTHTDLEVSLFEPLLDWREKPCAPADSFDFHKDPRAFLFTSVNCEFAARGEAVRQYCGECNMYFNAVSVGAQRKCVWICQQYDFQHTAVTTRIPAGLEAKISQQLGLPEGEKLSVVTIFYPRLLYHLNTLTRMSISEMISELGGEMGLFLGSSLISLLEVVVFVVLALCAFWGKLRSC
ncbi:Na+ channel domain containing protein [Penaeus vannamei]|uniref:Na+ channel domain containing protein n=1 Tax=Penaeus vannamei TaxID=6689 RepID=A0A3R7MHA5_PENVA|nr:Na+ channel domain containing protein [Penaeus vannamei]